MISYEDLDPLKITRLTDPFGRSATLTYNTAGQLASITDTLGLTSAFAYGDDDFVNSLRTPYGITTFRHEPNGYNVQNLRFIEATDPLGGTEHLEYQYTTPALVGEEPAGQIPPGFGDANQLLNFYNTLYWDKRAWAEGPNDMYVCRQRRRSPGGPANQRGR